MSDEKAAFEQWAILELFGHQKLAGRITEQVIAGAGFLRIEVPRKDGVVTIFQSPKSVYGIRPCTEEIATAVAHQLFGIEPVKPVDWSRQLPEGNRDDQDEHNEVLDD